MSMMNIAHVCSKISVANVNIFFQLTKDFLQKMMFFLHVKTFLYIFLNFCKSVFAKIRQRFCFFEVGC